MITNEDWFSGLAAGETLKLDFEMSYSGSEEPAVVGASLDGAEFCSGPIGTTEVITSTSTGGPPVSGEQRKGKLVLKLLHQDNVTP